MKVVKEHINEKFEDSSDPIKDMGIGLSPKMKKFVNILNKELKPSPYDYFSCEESEGEFFSVITFNEIIENISFFTDYIKKKGIEVDEIRFKRK